MKCPTCSKPVEWQDNPYRPFCSEHCKLVDLSRWVNDEYSIPGERAPDPEPAESASTPLRNQNPDEEL
jgi:endogenous inhibitor of DNA gyrase (YacG/DUF329 family)